MTKILIIEDSIVAAALMEANIKHKRKDIDVRVRRSMKGALEEAPVYQPDILLLDLNLSDVAPPETYDYMPQLARNCGCLIAMTALPEPHQKDTCLNNGAMDYMDKFLGSETNLMERLSPYIEKCHFCPSS
jgi:DNA-binding response OmpR family regulator